MGNRRWNVVSALAVTLVLGYAVVLAIGLHAGKLTMAEYQQFMNTIILPVLGYMARMLGDGRDS